MRLRNIKNAQDIIEASDYLLKDNITFNKTQPLELEIGCGKGAFIIGKAKQNPNINYIGMEKYASVLVGAIKKAEQENLDNLKFICMDAQTIDKMFNKTIDKLYLNFSDPWPKKKHAKRRLTSSNFLKIYDGIFKENPHIEMKTDNTNLFEYSLVSLSEYGYTLTEVNFDFTSEDNIETEYEQKFRKQGYPIHRLQAQVKKCKNVKKNGKN